IDRAIALHKMTRLLTLAAGGSGYLTFMGNEFGHPEWIDFPRPGNNNSFKYCRRQWSLLKNKDLKFRCLNDFDRDMIKTAKEYHIFDQEWPDLKWVHESDHVIAFERSGLLFAFNFSPDHSYTDYVIPVSHAADYKVLFSSDDSRYNGYDRVSHEPPIPYVIDKNGKNTVHLYLPARTATVLCPLDIIR
ncbi:MAG: alpha amylase C-terminal domain-containing protein, partial [Clostridia bacterium]|nr:alpha amylase C-terminal domain-containing protein [Clostridia bacterium]